MYEAEFTWSEPAASVIVTGDFDNWSQSVRLPKGEAGFTGKVHIPYGKKTDYKFVVDGHWTVNYNFPTEWDHSGNINNYIMAPSEPPPSVLAVNTAADAASGSGTSTEPEPVTPINRSVNASLAVTPLAVPESAIAPHPSLTFDSVMARSIVESFLEVVNPVATKSADAIPASTTDKVNEPASTVKDLADATAPSAAFSAVQGALSPYLAAAQEKATEGVHAINGSVLPLLHARHTSEAAPVSATEKQAEPGYPIRDLASLTGAAPVVVAAQERAAHGVSTLKESVAPLLKSASNATAVAPGEHAPANGEEKLAQPGYPIKDLASGPAQVLASAQGAISPAVASVNGAVSPVIASAQEKIAPAVAYAQEKAGPAVAYAQEKAGPVLAALQGAVHSAVATITESPSALSKDTLALPSKPVAEAPVAPAAVKEELVHGNEISETAKPDENPIANIAKQPAPLVVPAEPSLTPAVPTVAEEELVHGTEVSENAKPYDNPIAEAAKHPEPLAVSTEPITAAPVDLSVSPVEPTQTQAPIRPSTPPPTDKSMIVSPSTPAAAVSGPSPTSPATATNEKNGFKSNGPSSTFSGTTTSTVTTPVKPNNTKRTSSLGAKFFPRRGSAGSPGAGSGSDTEGNSPLRGSVKREDSTTSTGTNGRTKRKSIFGKIKDAFHHPDHAHDHTRSGSSGSK